MVSSNRERARYYRVSGEDMKESFLKRVLREKIVDTRKYRYTLQETCLFTDIVRLPIEYLDTPKAYEPWEVVCSYAKQITVYDE